MAYLNASSNASTITDQTEAIVIGSTWMPSIPFPLLLVSSLGIFAFLLVLFGSIRVARETKHVIEDEMHFEEEDDPAMYTSLTYSSSSQSEYLNINPNNPHIDPKVKKPSAATKFTVVDLQSPNDRGRTSTPPLSTPPVLALGPCHSSWRRNTDISREQLCCQLSPPLPPPTPPRSQNERTTQQLEPGSPSKLRRPPKKTSPAISVRESTSAPMVMNGLWRRIERLVKMGFDADASSCQLSSHQRNNNSELRPCSSDSASLSLTQPMTFGVDFNPRLIASSVVQSHDATSQTESGSPIFPRKISCTCCRERKNLLDSDSPAPKSSSSSLFRNIIYSRANPTTEGRIPESSVSSTPSTSGRPRLAVDEDDISNKICLSVDERLRRYRLCYSSGSSDEDTDGQGYPLDYNRRT